MEIARFSCGFFGECETDRILLDIIQNSVPKSKRGQELKSLAWSYLQKFEPELIEESRNRLNLNISKVSKTSYNTKNDNLSSNEEIKNSLSKQDSSLKKNSIKTLNPSEINKKYISSKNNIPEYNDFD